MGSNNLALPVLIAIALLYQGISAVYGNECPNVSPRWKDLGGEYCYIVETNETLSWIDAVYRCFSEGGSLASFHSAEELDRVIHEARGLDLRLFMGLRKRNDGSFQWVDKTPVDFTRWYPGEPNIDYEQCGEIYVEPGKWNDIDCRRRFQYVCSVPKNQPPRSVERKVCPNSSPEWSDFGGDACYIVERNNRTTWPEALRRCSEKGGSLASFHSIEEISAVVQHTKRISGVIYIGLEENEVNGSYSWADQSPMDLDFFHIPSSVVYVDEDLDATERKCGAMLTSNGEWIETWCGEPAAYICSAPKEILCGGDIVAPKGILKSPNFPNNYGRNEYCEWKITVSENRRIILAFREFRLQFGTACKKDYVKVLDGHETTSPVLETACGGIVPNPIYSTGNKMKVIFRSNAAKEFPGFLAEFQEDGCGGDIYGDKGTFMSPDFPENYRSNENCTWKITVPEGHHIILKFTSFELEKSTDCKFDRLEIRDGQEVDSPLLGQFCGSDKPADIRSSTNKISVRLVTDSLLENSGFNASFTKIAAHMEDVESVLTRVIPPDLLERMINTRKNITTS